MIMYSLSNKYFKFNHAANILIIPEAAKEIGENVIFHTLPFFSGVHQATQVADCCCSHGKCGGYGGPQADFVGERESSEIKRKLNGGPQADEGRIQVSINDD